MAFFFVYLTCLVASSRPNALLITPKMDFLSANLTAAPNIRLSKILAQGANSNDSDVALCEGIGSY